MTGWRAQRTADGGADRACRPLGIAALFAPVSCPGRRRGLLRRAGFPQARATRGRRIFAGDADGLGPDRRRTGAELQSPARAIAGDWWTLFHSPQLDRLIARALAANPDLQAAQYALREARENVRAEQGSFFPTVSGSTEATRARQSGAGFGAPGTSTLYTLYSATVSVSYTLDLFGGIRRQVEQLQAQAEYEGFLLEASYLTLTANVVTAAVAEASLRGQIAATEDIVAAERHELDLVRRQLDLGGISRADVLQQQATLAATEATLPGLRGQLAQERNQLAVYLGITPNQYSEASFDLAGLTLPDQLPLSLPSALVEQRPDIREYEALLHAASANVGVATANMLPQITLSADLGTDAGKIAKLLSPGTGVWSLAAELTQPIFEGGTLLARRRSAVAAFEQAGAQYRSTVISAFHDVANSLVALQADADTLRADLFAEQTAGASLELAKVQQRGGTGTYLSVLTAEQTFQTQRLNRVRAQAARYSDTAALFQALGGGWWQRRDVDPKTDRCCNLLP